MQPESAYDIYAAAIWNRDTLLLGVAVLILCYGAALIVGARYLPRLTKPATWIITGGFYASLVLAYFTIR